LFLFTHVLVDIWLVVLLDLILLIEVGVGDLTSLGFIME
jgi:hypothetical protein